MKRRTADARSKMEGNEKVSRTAQVQYLKMDRPWAAPSYGPHHQHHSLTFWLCLCSRSHYPNDVCGRAMSVFSPDLFSRDSLQNDGDVGICLLINLSKHCWPTFVLQKGMKLSRISEISIESSVVFLLSSSLYGPYQLCVFRQ